MEGKGNKVMMIVIIVQLLLVIGLVVAVGLLIMRSPMSGSAPEPTEVISTGLAAADLYNVPIDKITTNLARGADGKQHLIQLEVSAAIDKTHGKDSDALILLADDSRSMVFFKNAIISTVGTFSYEALDYGSDTGRKILRDEFLRAFNEIFQTTFIYDVQFSEYRVQ